MTQIGRPPARFSLRRPQAVAGMRPFVDVMAHDSQLMTRPSERPRQASHGPTPHKASTRSRRPRQAAEDHEYPRDDQPAARNRHGPPAARGPVPVRGPDQDQPHVHGVRGLETGEHQTGGHEPDSTRATAEPQRVAQRMTRRRGEPRAESACRSPRPLSRSLRWTLRPCGSAVGSETSCRGGAPVRGRHGSLLVAHNRPPTSVLSLVCGSCSRS